MPGLLILPSLYFTERNVSQRQGFVGWQVGTQDVANKKLLVGEIGEPLGPMDPYLGGRLEIALAWAAEKRDGGDWEKAGSLTITITDEDYTGADYENGSAAFTANDGSKLTIVPPGTMEDIKQKAWDRIKAIAQA